jgi:6-bladed beta-propeller
LFLAATLIAAEPAIQKITPTQAMGSVGHDYYFSFPIELNIIDDMLYVIDQKTNTIFVFDSQSMAFIRKFGQTGNEPGSYDRALSINADGWGNLAVSDYNNDRLQIISPYGEFLQEFELIYPWKTTYYDQQLYIDVFPGSDQAGIYSFSDGNISLEVDLAKYFKKKYFGSVLDKYYTYCVTDWGYVASFSGRDEIIFFNNSGKPRRTKVDKLPLTYENTLYGKPLTFQEGFLVLATSNDHQNADSTQTAISYQNLIGQYDKRGNLKKVYELPAKIWLTDSWAIYKNDAFLYDSNELKIYKFSLD